MLRKVIITLGLILGGINLSIAGDIPITQIKGLFLKFKPEYRVLSPVQGLLALRSGILKNIRFKGYYGTLKPEFLCHNQVINAGKKESDCPQDNTTAVIQHLSPSPNGRDLSLPGSDNDFFNILTMKQLAELLSAFHDARLIYQERSKENLEIAQQEIIQRMFEQFNRLHQQIMKDEEKAKLNKELEAKQREKSPVNKDFKLINGFLKEVNIEELEKEAHFKGVGISISLKEALQKHWSNLDSEKRALEEKLSQQPVSQEKKPKKPSSQEMAYKSLIQKIRDLTKLLESKEDLFGKWNDLKIILERLESEEEQINQKIRSLGNPKEKLKLTMKNWEDIVEGKVESLLENYAKIFAGSVFEQDRYPSNIVETALLAFVWGKARTIKDLDVFIEALEKYHEDNVPLSSGVYSKKSYTAWKNYASNNVNVRYFQDLIGRHNPEVRIFMTLAGGVFESPYPELPGMGNASVKGKTKMYFFKDCGESTLRNFLNVMLADSDTNTFKLENLAQFNPTPQLIKFYQQEQKTYEDVLKFGIRSVWAKVVSGLKGVDYRNGLQDIGNEISSANGISNMLQALEQLLGLEDLWAEIRQKHPTDENALIGALLDDLCHRLSRTGFVVDWRVKGAEKQIPGKFVEIILKINGKEKFQWSFIYGHFSFDLIYHHELTDWRKDPLMMEGFMTQLQEMSPQEQEGWIGLLPYYLNDHLVETIVVPKFQQFTQPQFSSYLLYGVPFTKTETQGEREDELLQRLDWLLSVNPAVVEKLIPKWLQTIPQDKKVAQHMASLIAKHESIFYETYFNKNILPKIQKYYEDYITTLLQTVSKTPEALFPLFKDSKNEGLIHYVIKKFSNEADLIGALKDTKGHTLLHRAAGGGFIMVIKALLENEAIAQKILSPDNVINKEDENMSPLHMAALMGQLEATKLLLQYQEALFLDDTYWNAGGERNTPMALAEFGQQNTSDSPLKLKSYQQIIELLKQVKK
jgi:hypothetical protein